MQDSIITLSDIAKVYRKKIVALNQISLEIARGEFIALTGASGSGKSTLLEIIGGLLPPTRGTVNFDGKNIYRIGGENWRAKFRNQKIGFVFQSFYLQPFLSICENIAIASYPARLEKTKIRERVNFLAKEIGITELLDRKPSELSGGQIQRVAIARSLMNNPSVIIADEPTGNLDQKNSENVVKILENFREKYHTTIILATHNPEIAACADRVIKLEKGEIVG